MILDQSEYWDKIIHAFARVDSEPEGQIIDFLRTGPRLVGNYGIDIGCGSGRHSLEAARRGNNIAAIDWSNVACLETQKAAALRGYRIAVCRARMEYLPLADDKFDFAICWCVLNHGTRKSFEEGLSEAFRVLRQG